MTTMHDRYPDLFDGQTETDIEPVVSDLERLAQPINTLAMPQEHYERIKQSLLKQMQSRQKRSWLTTAALLVPQRRYRWLSIAAVVLAVLIVSGTVLAATHASVVGSMFQILSMNSSGQYNHLAGQEISNKQEVCGVTFKIGRVYADQQETRVAMAINVPATNVPGAYPPDLLRRPLVPFFFASITASINGGPESPVDQGAGVGLGTGGQRQLLEVRSFLTPVVAGDVKNLNVRLHIVSMGYDMPGANAKPPLQSTCPFTRHAISTSQGATTRFLYQLNTFMSVTVPYTPGNESQINQTKYSGSVHVTLDHVIVASGGIYVYLQSSVGLITNANLRIGGQDAIPLGSYINAKDGEGVYPFSNILAAKQHNAHAELTLTSASQGEIDTLRQNQAVPAVLPGGPITFDFTIP